MEFELIGRKISVGAKHIWLVLAVMLFWTILVAVPTALYAFAFPLDEQASFDANLLLASISVSFLLGLISQPLLSYLFLKAAPYFRLKADVGFCRSIAMANFIVSSILILLGFLGLILLAYLMGDIIIGSIAGILEAAVGAVLVYLWMLFFLKSDKEKTKKAAEYAVIFATAMILIRSLTTFFVNYNINVLYTVGFELELLWQFIAYFLFGFILLYHIPKKHGIESYFFAGLYIALFLFSVLVSIFLFVVEGDSIVGPVATSDSMLDALLSLGALFILGRTMHGNMD